MISLKEQLKALRLFKYRTKPTEHDARCSICMARMEKGEPQIGLGLGNTRQYCHVHCFACQLNKLKRKTGINFDICLTCEDRFKCWTEND